MKRHHVAGLLGHSGTDRKRFKGDPAPTQVQQGNTTQRTEPWAAQAPYLGGGGVLFTSPTGDTTETKIPGIFQLARDQYQSQNPQFYPGSTVTGFNPDQMAAINAQRNIATGPNPLLDNAYKTNAAYAGGDFSNPAIQGVMDANRAAIMPAVDARFGLAGRSFSPAHAATLGKAITTANAPLLFGAQQGAIQNAPALSAARYNDASQLGQLGEQQQMQGQTELNADIERHNFEQNKESNKLAQYLQMVQGNYGGTTTGLNTAQQTVAQSKGAQQTAGNVLKLAGMAAAASDRRLKTDIRRVGYTDDGLPIYVYRYNGSPQFAMGVMADEVEKIKPEAVTKIGEFKAVYYGAL